MALKAPSKRKKTDKTTVANQDQTPVFQLKITLKDIRPPIWRRLLVPGALTLDRLHDTIQKAMGWEDYHLHLFKIHNEFYSIPSPEDWEPMKDATQFRLDRLGLTEKAKFMYEYDFGDSWQHDIVVEKILPADASLQHPVCIKGKRACPPEDSGGVWGYESFLEAINDPSHEEHESTREWWGADFDAEAFDIEDVNQQLALV